MSEAIEMTITVKTEDKNLLASLVGICVANPDEPPEWFKAFADDLYNHKIIHHPEAWKRLLAGLAQGLKAMTHTSTRGRE